MVYVARSRGKNVEQRLSRRAIGIVRWNRSGNRSARLAQLVERQTVNLVLQEVFPPGETPPATLPKKPSVGQRFKPATERSEIGEIIFAIFVSDCLEATACVIVIV